MTTILQRPDITSHYSLAKEQIHFFQENGFIKLKNVLSQDALKYYGEIITQKVFELNKQSLPMTERTTYQKAFIQIGNLWRKSEVVKEFCWSERLARIATELMGISGVRMWHDQALYKESGGGITPWHADQFYWPMSNANAVTAWIPLQETPLNMGPLEFSAKSHTFKIGRDLSISDESEAKLQKSLKNANFKHVIEPYDLGEVSFHYGWTFHHAAPNVSHAPRKVMTIIYMDEDMRLAKSTNKNQEVDRQAFCPGLEVGDLMDTEMNPIIWSSREN
jgi:ectoine hydroxylase-related dioxygenase (phytanoyl-CoA dioxygenase family)